MFKEIELIDGEVVDTRGGFTYRDVWCEVTDDKYTFYERYYGYKDFGSDDGDEKIYDENEIKYLMTLVKNKR